MEKIQVQPKNGKNSSIGNSQTILDPNDHSISVSGMLNDYINNNFINDDIENKKPKRIVKKILPQNFINKKGEIKKVTPHLIKVRNNLLNLNNLNIIAKIMNTDIDENKEIP